MEQDDAGRYLQEASETLLILQGSERNPMVCHPAYDHMELDNLSSPWHSHHVLVSCVRCMRVTSCSVGQVSHGYCLARAGLLKVRPVAAAHLAPAVPTSHAAERRARPGGGLVQSAAGEDHRSADRYTMPDSAESCRVMTRPSAESLLHREVTILAVCLAVCCCSKPASY